MRVTAARTRRVYRFPSRVAVKSASGGLGAGTEGKKGGGGFSKESKNGDILSENGPPPSPTSCPIFKQNELSRNSHPFTQKGAGLSSGPRKAAAYAKGSFTTVGSTPIDLHLALRRQLFRNHFGLGEEQKVISAAGFGIRS
jgi:hypothetical protein